MYVLRAMCYVLYTMYSVLCYKLLFYVLCYELYSIYSVLCYVLSVLKGFIYSILERDDMYYVQFAICYTIHACNVLYYAPGVCVLYVFHSLYYLICDTCYVLWSVLCVLYPLCSILHVLWYTCAVIYYAIWYVCTMYFELWLGYMVRAIFYMLCALCCVLSLNAFSICVLQNINENVLRPICHVLYHPCIQCTLYYALGIGYPRYVLCSVLCVMRMCYICYILVRYVLYVFLCTMC